MSDLLLPAGRDVPLLPTKEPLAVGDERIRTFLESLSRHLLRPDLARRFPELGSLGFFLRRGEIARALARLDQAHIRVPRGLVFHVPPANVDTVFVYSWALSALAGNHNVVRLSPRAGQAANAVLRAMNDALDDAHPAVAQTQRVIAYSRDDELTARLSSACDLRVIWGGDAAVGAIRRHPLKPWARDLTFPDKSSFAVICTDSWRDADDATKNAAAEAFANDAYWFDQAACASPRTIFWVGSQAEGGPAADDFAGRLAATVERRGWTVDAAMAVEKRVASYGCAADGTVGRIDFRGNSVATLALRTPGDLPRRWLGAGTFAHTCVSSLGDLAPIVQRKDQTLTHFGFSEAELREFAVRLAGRGIDRIVPFGAALTFHPVWDGLDLLAEFTRLVTVTV